MDSATSYNNSSEIAQIHRQQSKRGIEKKIRNESVCLIAPVKHHQRIGKPVVCAEISLRRIANTKTKRAVISTTGPVVVPGPHGSGYKGTPPTQQQYAKQSVTYGFRGLYAAYGKDEDKDDDENAKEEPSAGGNGKDGDDPNDGHGLKDESATAQQHTKRCNEYFVLSDGIDEDVITADAVRFLGNDASVRPGHYTSPRTNNTSAGYFVIAYRNFTRAMLDDLKTSTNRHKAAKAAAARRAEAYRGYRVKHPERPHQEQA